jgi:SAM-dependent methyltransferase
MDKSAIDDFWRQRAAQGTGRWTEPELMRFERGLLLPHIVASSRILDLGCGPASLSLALLDRAAALTCVDKCQGFLDAVPADPRITKVCADVVEFRSVGNHDLILLFGVVTHLDADEEMAVYRNAAECLAPNGVMVVKNQVSRAGEKLFDGYSENLKCRYVGRYPDLPGQKMRLQSVFANVEPRLYPTEFDKWPDTQHVAFICSPHR